MTMPPARRISTPSLPSREVVCVRLETNEQKIWMIAFEAFRATPDYSGRSTTLDSCYCENCGGWTDPGTLMLVLVEVEGERDARPKPDGLVLQAGWRCALGAVAGGAVALHEHEMVMRHYKN